jgi:hypothetical protein
MPRRKQRTPDLASRTPPEPEPAPSAPSPAAAVLTLQRQAGNQATAALLARQPEPKRVHLEHFVLGSDVSLALAKRAKALATKGLDAAALGELRDLALASDESVDDSERLFVTALMEPGNPERLAAAKLKAGEKVSLTLALDRTTKANLRKVADVGRPEIDPGITKAVDEATDARGHGDAAVADKATKRAEDAASKQLLALAGARNKKRASAVIAFAGKANVPLRDVVAAMIAAASDSTEDDLLCAAIAFTVATAVGHAGAPHLRTGAIKVDARPIPGGASGLYNPIADATGGKGDTLFLPPGLDITNLGHRGTVIHELQHAVQDSKAPGSAPQLADRVPHEVEAYVVEGEYMLRQLAALPPGAARKAAAQPVTNHWGLSVACGMILASQADKTGELAKIITEINGLAAAKDRIDPKALAVVLKAPPDDLRSLIAKSQQTSSVRFDRFSGESRISGALPRRRIKDDTADVVRFTVGVELMPELAQRAWERTRTGALDDAGLAELRAIALSKGETIDDNERMFMAGLLDEANARKLHAQHPAGFTASGAAVDFDSTTITAGNRNRVKDFGRNVRPEDPPVSKEQEKRERGTDAAIDRQMERMAGPYAITVTDSLKLADEAKISHLSVYYAMLNAASDSTAVDRAVSAAAYVVARREGLAEAADLLAGRIKVDAVPASYLPNEWDAMYSPEGGTTKGDTVYLPTGLDPTSLKDQGTVIHELTHAAGDKAAARGTAYLKAQSELASYRREARFYLEAIAKRTGPARTAEIEALGQRLSKHVTWCLILESNARTDINEAYAFNDIVRELNAVTHPLPTADLERGLDHSTVAQNEAAAIKEIEAVYKFKRGQKGSRSGLRGESELDE